jgi:hypothetical protein
MAEGQRELDLGDEPDVEQGLERGVEPGRRQGREHAAELDARRGGLGGGGEWGEKVDQDN